MNRALLTGLLTALAICTLLAVRSCRMANDEAAEYAAQAQAAISNVQMLTRLRAMENRLQAENEEKQNVLSCDLAKITNKIKESGRKAEPVQNWLDTPLPPDIAGLLQDRMAATNPAPGTAASPAPH